MPPQTPRCTRSSGSAERNLDFEPPIADGDLPDDLQIFGPYGNLNCGSFEWDPNFLFSDVELTAQTPGYTVGP